MSCQEDAHTHHSHTNSSHTSKRFNKSANAIKARSLDPAPPSLFIHSAKHTEVWCPYWIEIEFAWCRLVSLINIYIKYKVVVGRSDWGVCWSTADIQTAHNLWSATATYWEQRQQGETIVWSTQRDDRPLDRPLDSNIAEDLAAFFCLLSTIVRAHRKAVQAYDQRRIRFDRIYCMFWVYLVPWKWSLVVILTRSQNAISLTDQRKKTRKQISC